MIRIAVLVALCASLAAAEPAELRIDLKFDRAPVTEVLAHIRDAGGLGLVWADSDLLPSGQPPIIVSFVAKGVQPALAAQAVCSAAGLRLRRLDDTLYAVERPQAVPAQPCRCAETREDAAP